MRVYRVLRINAVVYKLGIKRAVLALMAVNRCS